MRTHSNKCGLLLLLLLPAAFLLATEAKKKVLVSEEVLSKQPYEELHRLAVQQQSRDVQLLDGMWHFCLDMESRGFEERWFSGAIQANENCKRDYYQMPVPSAFNDVPSNEEVRNFIGWVWYQRVFYISPALNASARYKLLHFENVNYMAVVWLSWPSSARAEQAAGRAADNSILLGTHVGGFLPFQLNATLATDLARTPGQAFLLTVAVSNQLTENTIPSGTTRDLSELVGNKFTKFVPDFDFFHYAGIMGSVKLVYLPEVFLSKVELKESARGERQPASVSAKICIKTPALQSTIQNQSAPADANSSQAIMRLSLSLLDRDSPLAGASEPMFLGAAEEIQLKANPRGECRTVPLPFLSNLTARLEQDSCGHFQGAPAPSDSRLLRFRLEFPGQPSDVYELKLSSLLRPTDWLRGRRKHLQGFGMHHEQLFSGRTMSGAAIMKDLYLLKWMGANIIRTSHYPYSEAFLEACDELGILVVAECQAVGLRSFGELKLMLHKQLLLEMMERDHSHPSILMWSVANEPQSQLNESRPYFEELLRYSREELRRFTVEAGRPLTAALAQSHQTDQVGHTLDVIMLNRYFGWYEHAGLLQAIRKPMLESLWGWSERYNHSKGLLVSEFGAEAFPGLHQKAVPGVELFSEEYQSKLLLEHEQLFEEIRRNTSSPLKANFLGSMIWNLADFTTQDSLERAGGQNRKGVFTSDRRPKMAVEPIRKLYHERLSETCL